ncbi:TPA: nucleotide exchange factor GrpE [Candidatus Scatousia excrementigallinarum]|uniref:Protein GrpE n=1 Tax=Candidatus Scatousia excrementigallinarum TaxID=2840935 RepID=A0A9D1EZY5_9BACT|nr:nucleotide exchange factor GrpE [Candidatus Scatousia excrementigallinarum]
MSHKHGNNPFKKHHEEEEKLENKENEQVKDSEDTESAPSESDENNTELEKLKEDYDKLNNQYLRLAADFDNFRKRQEQERENLLKFGLENAMKKMIEVLDNFDRGEKALENVEDCQQVKDSFNLVHKQTLEALTKLGLEMIEAENQDFDPNYHEAVMRTPTEEHPENTVISVLQKGYKMGDKVLRPALVNVAASD